MARTAADVVSTWKIEDSLDLYQVPAWGRHYFGINAAGHVVVRPDGKFSVPLAGEIVAARRTVDQISTDITNRLKKFIPEAVVTVSVTKLEGNRIYVIGQVNKPGTFTMNPRLNVLQALSMAGGMTAFASTNDIIVMRGSAGAAAGQRMIPFRFGDVSRGRNLEQNIQLEAGDVVIVP